MTERSTHHAPFTHGMDLDGLGLAGDREHGTHGTHELLAQPAASLDADPTLKDA